MKRVCLTVLLYLLSISVFMIAVYQFAGGELTDGILILIFFSVLLAGAIHHYLRADKVS